MVKLGDSIVTLFRTKNGVICCDIGLPEGDRYDLIKKVRALQPKDGGTIPAIALTRLRRS
jgi:CheY-like chemotaxis protein